MADREDFERRLNAARGRQPNDQEPANPSALGMAFRLSTELVAGVLVGSGMGWGLDYWLDTRPWFLLVFFFLGAAAGILNAVRAAREMNEQN